MSKAYTQLGALIAVLLLCGPMHAEQLVFDDFSIADPGVSLIGQAPLVGQVVYDGPGSSSFQFGEIEARSVVHSVLGKNDATASFAVPREATAGKMRFDAIVNFNENKFTGIAGPWIGFTPSNSRGLLYGVENNYAVLRFFSTGKDAGRLQLRTSEEMAVSSIASALEIYKDRDYLLSLEYDFDSLRATATVTDLVLLTSTSASYLFESAIEFTKAQFDLTGLSVNDRVDELPYFKSIAVTLNF